MRVMTLGGLGLIPSSVAPAINIAPPSRRGVRGLGDLEDVTTGVGVGAIGLLVGGAVGFAVGAAVVAWAVAR